MAPVSIRPSDFVEGGGAVPVDKQLTWKQARFNVFDYKKKDGTIVAQTVALRISYVDEAGGEYEQQYSVGDPKRFQPSDDGKTLVSVVEGEQPNRSSNAYILLNALVNAGFPENRIPENGDVSVFDGLVTFNIGLPEPKRSGLVRVEEEGARARVLSVPSQIIKLPWEKKAGKAGAKTPTATKSEGEGEDNEALVAKAVEFVGKHLVDGATTRQKLGVAVFREMAKDPDKDAFAKLIYSAELSAALLGAGYSVDGEKISKS